MLPPLISPVLHPFDWEISDGSRNGHLKMTIRGACEGMAGQRWKHRLQLELPHRIALIWASGDRPADRSQKVAIGGFQHRTDFVEILVDGPWLDAIGQQMQRVPLEARIMALQSTPPDPIVPIPTGSKPSERCHVQRRLISIF
jgi:hypothetical protein